MGILVHGQPAANAAAARSRVIQHASRLLVMEPSAIEKVLRAVGYDQLLARQFNEAEPANTRQVFAPGPPAESVAVEPVDSPVETFNSEPAGDEDGGEVDGDAEPE